MTNISKQGVISSSGSPNPNLLPHTDTKSYGTGYMASYSSGTFSVDNTVLFNGKPSIKIQPSSSKTGSGAYNRYNTDSVSLTSGTQYCYSCWILSDTADTWASSSLGHFQTYTSSAPHNRTIQHEGDAIPTNIWTKVYITFTPSVNCVFRSYHIYFENTSQTIWIADVKLEEGAVPTAWIPNINDSFVPDSGFTELDTKVKIQENGYIQANQFIEF